MSTRFMVIAAALLLAAGAAHAQHAKHEKHAEKHAHPHASHRFDDAEKWAAMFESKKRDAWQKPDKVIEALALEPGMVVADIGAATGYFPVRIAPRVKEGRVWGVDVEPDMVRYLNARARREKLGNLWSILGTAEDPLLPETVDRVLMVDTIHHIAERPAYFRRLAGQVARDGKLVVVDFKMGKLPVGPPDAAKLAPATVIAELETSGWTLERREEKLLPHQYILVFTRSAE